VQWALGAAALMLHQSSLESCGHNRVSCAARKDLAHNGKACLMFAFQLRLYESLWRVAQALSGILSEGDKER
jgi:hypothetical protein